MDDSVHRALAESDIRRLVTQIGRPAMKLKGQHPDDQVVMAIGAMAGSEESLKSGELVCRVLRLPIPWRQTLLECLNGTEPYVTSESRPDGVVEIRNDGSDLDYLARHIRDVPYNTITGKPEPERTTYREDRKIWAAGDVKQLPLGTAIRLLQTHSAQAVNPLHRGTVDFRPERLPLREIGYRITLFDQDQGEMVTHESKGFGKAKKQAA
jgi:hypothetical protein